MAGKSIKLETGTIYQKEAGGCYFFRYQLNGQRKAVSLQTKSQKEAIAKAKAIAPVVKASSLEVVAAHVTHAQSWTKNEKRLELANAWPTYDRHPDRARPATVDVYLRYQAYFGEFVAWAIANGHVFLDEITDEVVSDYADTLRSMEISVDTHNKRIARVSHVFRTLKEYTREDTSDWTNRAFRRKNREEVGLGARRLPFTREQEEQLFAVLEDPHKRCKNKLELRVLFHLGAFTGQRLKDCALLQWHKVDLSRQRISITQFKTGKDVTIPVAPRLLAVLKEAEEWRRNNYVLPEVAERYSRKSNIGAGNGPGFLNVDIRRVIRWIGLEPNMKVPGRDRAVTVYGFHSLRHSFVSFCIDHNIPKAVTVSILGADSDIIDQYYTHVGDDAQEQAIQLISGTGMSMKQRHERALEYLAGIAQKSPQLQELERILSGHDPVP